MKIRYPKTLEDIPVDRQKELEESLSHFLKFSPCKRLSYIEREWAEWQEYIQRFGIVKKI